MTKPSPLRKSAARIAAGAVLTLTALLACAGCSRTPAPVTPADEALYYLVGEPCSEGDFPTAIARADSLLSGVEMSDSVRAYIMLDRNVAILNLGHLEWGGAYADTVIDFGRRSGVELAVTQGLQNRGGSRRRLGDNDGAIADYSEALRIITASGDKEMEQALTESLAIAMAERRRLDESLRFGRRSLQLAIEAGDSVGALNAASTIGAVMVLGKRYGEVTEALAPYRNLANAATAPMRVKYLTPLVKTYFALDSLDRVRELVAEADSVAATLPEHHQSRFVVADMKGELAEREGRYADRWKILCEMDSYGPQGSMPWIVYGKKAECLARLGRYEEAYGWQLRAFENRDSVAGEQTDERLSELSVSYDTLLKEKEIERLRSQRLGWIAIALGAVLVLVAVVAAAMVLRARAKRKMERERHAEFIRGVEQERQRISRELHDDIAGRLIGMQWMMQTLSPEEAGTMVSDIGMRVRELSHELMPPQFADQTFPQLLLDFTSRFNAGHKDFHIELTDEGSYPWDSLPSDRSHEFYRIVQEAVNNAVRHGAPGAIRITLSGSDAPGLTVVNGLRPGHAAGEEPELRSLRTRAAILGAKLDCRVSDDQFSISLTGIRQ